MPDARLDDLRQRLEPLLAQVPERVRDARPDALREEPLASIANAFLAGFVAGRVVRRILR